MSCLFVLRGWSWMETRNCCHDRSFDIFGTASAFQAHISCGSVLFCGLVMYSCSPGWCFSGESLCPYFKGSVHFMRTWTWRWE